MVFVLETHGAQHRAEDFFLRQPVVGRHVAEQRGGLVKAAVGRFINDLALRHDRDARDMRIA